MTKDGILFVEEGLQERYDDELPEGARLEAPFGWGENLERYWPDESDVPIMQYDEQIGVLHVELDSTVKRNPATGQEYLGKEITDYEIEITK